MQLGTRFQQLVQRAHLARDVGRREVIHAVKADVDRQIAFATECVGHIERDPWLDRLHAGIEIVQVDFQKFAVGNRWLFNVGLASQIGHHAHHKRNLHLLLGAVNLHVILNLNPRRPVLGDPLLSAFLAAHGVAPWVMKVIGSRASCALNSRAAHLSAFPAVTRRRA